jgi:hypothetical protein
VVSAIPSGYIKHQSSQRGIQEAREGHAVIGSEGVSATGASVSAQKAREWITFGDLNRKYGRG